MFALQSLERKPCTECNFRPPDDVLPVSYWRSRKPLSKLREMVMAAMDGLHMGDVGAPTASRVTICVLSFLSTMDFFT